MTLIMMIMMSTVIIIIMMVTILMIFEKYSVVLICAATPYRYTSCHKYILAHTKTNGNTYIVHAPQLRLSCKSTQALIKKKFHDNSITFFYDQTHLLHDRNFLFG